MSRPRHYWYGIVRTMVRQPLREENAIEKIFIDAIRDTDEELLKLDDGETRLRAVKAVLVERRSYDFVAWEENYSWRTIQNWANRYIDTIGKKAGF